ncbi:hypothetical protein VTK56DRAFT_865 [Thermocarpiscus australiensis]
MSAPDQARFSLQAHNVTGDKQTVTLYDSDTRRVISVVLPNSDPRLRRDFNPEYVLTSWKQASEILAKEIDGLPRDAVIVHVDEFGRLENFSVDPKDDTTLGTDHFRLEQYWLPSEITGRTILRSGLTEIRRLGCEADLVSYGPDHVPTNPGCSNEASLYLFKYSTAFALPIWYEVQILARLPKHPNVVPLDRLVLDELTQSRVVGFTMKAVAVGRTHHDTRPPVFKLKWLRQLMQLVDDLNLGHEILRRDIADRNLIVDSSTDTILLINFHKGCRIGGDRILDEKDDIRGVKVFVYKLITQDPSRKEDSFGRIDEKDIENPAKWVRHPGVQLDNSVAEFYFEVMTWAAMRCAGKSTMRRTEVLRHLVYPRVTCSVKQISYVVGQRRQAGLPFLEWERPALSQLGGTRRLLATGKSSNIDMRWYSAIFPVTAYEVVAANNARSLNITALSSRNGYSVIECWQLSSIPIDAMSAANYAVGNTTMATWSRIEPRTIVGEAWAPHVQLSIILNGLIRITSPTPAGGGPSVSMCAQHGAYEGQGRPDTKVAYIMPGTVQSSVLIAADLKGASTIAGHYTEFPSDEPTILVQMPFENEKAPEHTVVHDGPCV